MREIKFRGKRIDNEDWVYGYYVLSHAGRHGINYGFKECPQVIAATVGQFTGLVDKNGVEIYEGDVLKADYTDTLKVVLWDDNRAAFIGQNGFNELLFNDLLLYEVIGNVHQTKES